MNGRLGVARVRRSNRGAPQAAQMIEQLEGRTLMSASDLAAAALPAVAADGAAVDDVPASAAVTATATGRMVARNGLMRFRVVFQSDCMVGAIKQCVAVQPGGIVQVRSPELRPGARAEVIVLDAMRDLAPAEGGHDLPAVEGARPNSERPGIAIPVVRLTTR